MSLRVLIVDDSPIVRGVLRSVLERDLEIEVVGEAGNGLRAKELVKELHPDVVTMDVLMPMMGGMEAIRTIMDECPVPIVVVADAQGNADTLAMEALGCGAAEVFPKPRAGFDGLVATELTETLKRAGRIRLTPQRDRPKPQTLSAFRVPLAAPDGLFVAIAGSTGGPKVLQLILTELAADYPHPIAICQHTTRGFTESLADWLDGISALTVKVARHGEIVRPGEVVIAPDDHHLEIRTGGEVYLDRGAPVDGHRPSGTVLLSSVASSFKSRALGLVVTGMGRDGADGLRDIERAGGTVLVEEPDTATVGGMPREAVAATRSPIRIRAEHLSHVFTLLGLAEATK